MSFWDRLRQVFGREVEDARELADEIEAKIDADLDRRERELNATPEERLESAIEGAAKADAEFEEIARRIADERPPPP